MAGLNRVSGRVSATGRDIRPQRVHYRMATAVHWRLMFRVNDRKAFDKCLARVLPLLGLGVVGGEGQPYWKIPELWECAVDGPALFGSAAEQVFECLLVAKRLAPGWHIGGFLSTDSALGFSGVFAAGPSGAASSVPGLEWASFDIVDATPADPGTAPDPAS
jgi:hypothetical protein